MSALFAGESRTPSGQSFDPRARSFTASGSPAAPRPNLGAVPLLPVPWRHDDFAPADLAAAKADLGLTVSVCLPARNEEATVGHIVATVRRTLMEEVALVDEVARARRRVDGLHRRGRVVGGRAGRRGRTTCCPRPARDRARATRCGSRSTPPRATSSAGSTPTSATSARTSSPGCSVRC